MFGHGWSIALFFEEEAAEGAMATVELKLAIAGRDASGDVRRHQIRIDKSWERLFDGESACRSKTARRSRRFFKPRS
jgi:hypothetical protein